MAHCAITSLKDFGHWAKKVSFSHVGEQKMEVSCFVRLLKQQDQQNPTIIIDTEIENLSFLPETETSLLTDLIFGGQAILTV